MDLPVRPFRIDDAEPPLDAHWRTATTLSRPVRSVRFGGETDDWAAL